MPDRDAILDALMVGDSVGTVADRFDISLREVREILREESERTYDGAEMRVEWTLTQRRLRRMELASTGIILKTLTVMRPWLQSRRPSVGRA